MLKRSLVLVLILVFIIVIIVVSFFVLVDVSVVIVFDVVGGEVLVERTLWFLAVMKSFRPAVDVREDLGLRLVGGKLLGPSGGRQEE